MTVFNAYLKILNKNKTLVIIYTVILVFFAGFNMKNSDLNTSFVAEKPNLLIVNNDEEKGLTKGLIEYMEKNSKIISVKENEEARADALFYREVNYIIYIPENFRENFLSGKNPKIEVKSTGDYYASLAEMMLNRYLNVASIYQTMVKDEEQLLVMINETLDKKIEVEVTSKLDQDQFSRASLYYNFANYSLLAGCVFVICFIISSFKDKKIRKRTMVSSIDYKKYNQKLLFANGVFAFTLWLLYVLLSILLMKDVMITGHGLLLILNSFVFTIFALTLALFIGNLIDNKEAISGIVNVIALGSSFLCGAFVPMKWLPDFVITLAHILPSYYYINNNDRITKLENFDFETLLPVITNILILFGFILFFILMTNLVTKKKNHIV